MALRRVGAFWGFGYWIYMRFHYPTDLRAISYNEGVRTYCFVGFRALGSTHGISEAKKATQTFGSDK